MPGVDAVEGQAPVSARIVRADGTYVDIQFTALEDPNDLTLNLLKPAAGETIDSHLWRQGNDLDASCAIAWL